MIYPSIYIHKICHKKILNAIKDGIMLLEPTGKILFANKVAERLWEKPNQELQKTNLVTLHPGLDTAIQRALTEKVSTLDLIDIEHAHILLKVHIGPLAQQWAAERNLAFDNLVVVEMEDVTEYIPRPRTPMETNYASKDELYNLIYRDHLTNALNRRYFDLSMPEVLNQAALQNSSVSLLLIDIDQFKSINDTYGHQAGDLVLQMVAECMKSNSRKDDLVFRLGGDEFALILVNISSKVALERAEKMRTDITEQSLGGDTPIPPITISAGIATFPEHTNLLEKLYRHADTALYQAKAHGRNRVRIYNAGQS